jgi:PA14 domain
MMCAMRTPWMALVAMLVSTSCSTASTSGVTEGEGEGQLPSEGEGEDGELSHEFRILGAVVSEVDFGDAEIGATSVEREVVIVNTGTRDIALLSLPPMLIGGAQSSSFVVTQQPGGTSIAVGTQLSVRIAFAPVDVGDNQGLLVFAYGVNEDDRGVLNLRGNATGNAAAPGVQAERYDDSFSLLPDFDGLVPAITERRSNFSIASEGGNDNFAFRFRASLAVPTAGDWTFFTTSDDGSRLLINDAIVVDNDGLHGPQERNGLVTLTAGRHDIEVQFFEQGGGEVLTVEWSGPELPRTTIPDAVLFDG